MARVSFSGYQSRKGPLPPCRARPLFPRSSRPHRRLSAAGPAPATWCRRPRTTPWDALAPLPLVKHSEIRKSGENAYTNDASHDTCSRYLQTTCTKTRQDRLHFLQKYSFRTPLLHMYLLWKSYRVYFRIASAI